MSNENKKNTKSKSKKAALTALIAPLIYLVLGLIMVIWPEKISNALCYILGAALTVYGLFNIISFFTNRESNLYLEIIIGVLATAFGIFTLFSPNTILNIIFTIVGIVIIIDSLADIKHSFELKSLGVKFWWISFIISLAIIILGITTIFFPTLFSDFIMILLGVILIYQGVSGIIIVALIGKHSKKEKSNYKKDNMIEVEATDVD